MAAKHLPLRDLSWDHMRHLEPKLVARGAPGVASTCVCWESLLSAAPELMLPAPNAAPERHLIAKGQPANGKLLS